MDFLIDGDGPDRPTLLLAHGAGAAMDSDFMARMAALLAREGLRVARFEFGYMAQRRTGGSKRPPPKIELLQQEYRAAIEALACDGPLFIGGKSMGGRVASLIADDLFKAGRIAGLVCLGYPFHPTGKPERLRTEHLAALRTPALICQGTRDPFGTREEVAGYALSESIALDWLDDGNHDLKPRKSVSGQSHEDNLARAAAAVSDWVARTV
ncbi:MULTISPECIES: alpha/beta family hydrolase [unclassified Salipiger]|uniref:alpha/beta fold hydrolase n=1 Tax=unclassified Salipiger TaxID=2640570 RepID=UPI0013B84F2D|nr:MULTISPECIES: alpha/beta family hydrolase [unclassified Salipiger]NDV48550.1 alpha/beta fold hydrolase [Salipiger sp. PrR003]NDW35367.1 alpha/beta fold hydrolase [Salipiger sp. PrR007]